MDAEPQSLPDPYPIDRQALLRGAFVVAGLFVLWVAGSLMAQLAKYDIYWNQDLGGLFMLVVNYGWLGMAMLLTVIATGLALATRRARGVQIAALLVAMAMLTWHMLYNASAYRTASIDTLPTMKLWWTIVVGTIAVVGVLVFNAGSKRIAVGIIGLAIVAGQVVAIQTAQASFTYRQQKSDSNQKYRDAYHTALNTNDASACERFVDAQNITTSRTDVLDDCYNDMMYQFKRTDLCDRLSAGSLDNMRRAGRCPGQATVYPAEIYVRSESATMVGSQVEYSWQTNIAAIATVEYGPTTSYGSTVRTNTYTSKDKVSVSPLSGPTIHFRVKVCTAEPTVYCYTSFDTQFDIPR